MRIFVTFLILAGIADASDLHLRWDISSTDNITNYNLYGGTNLPIVITNSLIHESVGTNNAIWLREVLPAKWWFVVTAQKDGKESDASNPIEVEIIAPPKNLMTVQVQWTESLITTNWKNAGYIRTILLEPPTQ